METEKINDPRFDGDRRIKLVVTDMDGTIIPEDEVLRDEVVAMKERLNANGIVFTLASGRQDCHMTDYVKKLGLDVPYVACNGCAVMHNGVAVTRETIPMLPLRVIADKADEIGMSVLFGMDLCDFAYRATDFVLEQRRRFDRYHEVRRFTDEQWQTLRLDKLFIVAKVEDGSIGGIEELCRELPDEFYYKRYADRAIDILPRAASKANGVRQVADMLGVKMSEVMAVGDDMNDTEMLRAAGIGVAVANASPGAKEAADYVTVGECYTGVIEAVKRFCGC